MSDEKIEIRAKLPSMADKNGNVFLPGAFSKAVDRLNKRAAEGRVLGQIDPPGDGRTRLNYVSHKVLPTAKLNPDRSVTVDIEVLNTPMGNQLRAMLEHSRRRIGVSTKGVLRGTGAAPEDVEFHSVDFDIVVPDDWTVLDGICDALDNEEKGT